MREGEETTPSGDERAAAPVVLEAVALTVRYPGHAAPALDRVSLRVRAGDVAVLLGPNGAGKSTLLRAVAGLARGASSEGEIRVGGKPSTELDRRAWARRVSFVAQEEPVAEGFTVREVVAMGRAPHQGAWLREDVADLQAVDAALARCDLGALADRNVETLSGGERRRVAVARALAQQAPAVVLDEPAAFLDVRHQIELRERLVGLARDGIACLVALHDLETAARIATRVVLLRAGRVVAAGPPREVMTPERLSETFDTPIDVLDHTPSGTRVFVARSSRDAASSLAPPPRDVPR